MAAWARLTVLPAGLLLSAAGLGALAAPSPATRRALDDAPDIRIELPTPAPIAIQPGIPNAPRSGNPLWAVPLSALSATRERPLFSPSRRPPSPPVVAAPQLAPPPPAPPPEPAQPPLALLGTISGGSEGLGIFQDQTNQGLIRLKVGQSHTGWLLISVHGREARFEKGKRSATLALPAPAESTRTAASAPAAGVPANNGWGWPSGGTPTTTAAIAPVAPPRPSPPLTVAAPAGAGWGWPAGN